jgi:hypothetical protein
MIKAAQCWIVRLSHPASPYAPFLVLDESTHQERAIDLVISAELAIGFEFR